MESSFYIWLARNSRDWSQNATNLIDSSNQPQPSHSAKSVLLPNSKKPLPSKATIPVKPAIPVKPECAGLINKGNTCYANYIFQALKVIPTMWSQWASESSSLSPLVRFIVLNMSLLSRSSHAAVDPTNFLRALQCKMSSIRKDPFNFNSQQDVPEILGVVLEELEGDSSLVENVLPITLRTTITCNTCFCSSITEDKSDILILPTFNQISSCLNESLKPEFLSGEHMWPCPQCSELRESTRETSISNCGHVLIVQLNRFSKFHGNTFKHTRFVECLPVKDHILTVPLKLDDNVSFSKEFSLVATINHSGSLNAGHYWAFIKDNIYKSWFRCDDHSILKVKPSTLNNTTSYVLFYVSS